MSRYKIIAHIINPFNEEQERNLGNNYAKVVNDFCFIEDEGFAFDERKRCIMQYPINGCIEEHSFDKEYFIDEDADGVYLLKKID